MCYLVYVRTSADLEGSAPSLLKVRQVSVVGSAQVFRIDSNGCGCDLVGTDTGDAMEAKLRRKYGRKGWSKQKIERAIDSRKLGVHPAYAAFYEWIGVVAGQGSAAVLACEDGEEEFNAPAATEVEHPKLANALVGSLGRWVQVAVKP